MDTVYQLTNDGIVRRRRTVETETGPQEQEAWIPDDPRNSDRQEYDKWLAAEDENGVSLNNAPLAADPE